MKQVLANIIHENFFCIDIGLHLHAYVLRLEFWSSGRNFSICRSNDPKIVLSQFYKGYIKWQTKKRIPSILV